MIESIYIKGIPESSTALKIAQNQIKPEINDKW